MFLLISTNTPARGVGEEEEGEDGEEGKEKKRKYHPIIGVDFLSS